MHKRGREREERTTGWYNDTDQLFDEKTKKKVSMIISRLFSSGGHLWFRKDNVG